MRAHRALAIVAMLLLASPASARAQQADERYLTWSKKQSEQVGRTWRREGQVGNRLRFRGLQTNRSVNFKVRATWLNAETIRASARIEQLRSRLSAQRTQDLVAEAMAVEGAVFLIELDPREGSGVIPRDWQALLQAAGGGPDGAVECVDTPALRDVRALSGTFERDYSYTSFWVVCPLTVDGGAPVFGQAPEAELIVRVLNQEEVLSWPVPTASLDLVPR